MKHEIIKVPEVFYPVSRAPHARAISRAIDKLVKPRKSWCHCGRNCAINRKHTALIQEASSKVRK